MEWSSGRVVDLPANRARSRSLIGCRPRTDRDSSESLDTRAEAQCMGGDVVGQGNPGNPGSDGASPCPVLRLFSPLFDGFEIGSFEGFDLLGLRKLHSYSF